MERLGRGRDLHFCAGPVFSFSAYVGVTERSRADKHAVGLFLPHHLLTIGVERVVDDPFRGIERVIVFIAEMARPKPRKT